MLNTIFVVGRDEYYHCYDAGATRCARSFAVVPFLVLSLTLRQKGQKGLAALLGKMLLAKDDLTLRGGLVEAV